MKLFKYRKQHALLAIVASKIGADALARAAVVEHLLAVEMLIAGFERAAVEMDLDVHVIVDAADGVHERLKALHAHAGIIGDRHAKEHFKGFLRVQEAVAVLCAALGEGGVDLPTAAGVVDGRIGIARYADEMRAVFRKIDRQQHQHIRAIVVAAAAVDVAVLVLALGAAVEAEQQDIDASRHKIRVRLGQKLLFGRKRRRRRGGRQIARGRGTVGEEGALGRAAHDIQRADAPGQE